MTDWYVPEASSTSPPPEGSGKAPSVHAADGVEHMVRRRRTTPFQADAGVDGAPPVPTRLTNVDAMSSR